MLAQRLRSTAPVLRELSMEFLGLAGLAAVGYGIWRIYVPAALIYAGLVFAVPYILRSIAQTRGNGR